VVRTFRFVGVDLFLALLIENYSGEAICLK
jgi:hypothetical protein